MIDATYQEEKIPNGMVDTSRYIDLAYVAIEEGEEVALWEVIVP